MGEAEEPRARGDLATTPFAHLVLYLHRERASGTLCIEHRGLEVKLQVREGRIIAAKPVERGASLQEGLLPLCAVESAPYTFWDQDLLKGASGVVRGTVDPSTFVTESLRQHAREPVVRGVLDRYRGMVFQLAPDVDLKRLGLRPREISVVETLLTRPCDEDTLISRASLSASEVRGLLYMLALHKLVSVEAAGEGAAGAGPAVSISPGWQPGRGGRSEAPPGSGQSLPPGSSVRAPGRPSRIPGRSVRPSVRPGASVPAWQQLASRRAGSVSQMPAARVPSMAPPPVEMLDAAGKLRRIEQLCEREEYAAALRIADALVAEDDRLAENFAVKAWVQLLTWTGERIPRALADSVTQALKLDPDNVRALFVKGLIHKRTGKEREARRHFARVVELDPNHVDAQRELRLARLRSGK